MNWDLLFTLLGVVSGALVFAGVFYMATPQHDPDDVERATQLLDRSQGGGW